MKKNLGIMLVEDDTVDKADRFDPGVSGYMAKSVGHAQFVEVMKTINRYRTLSELPGDN